MLRVKHNNYYQQHKFLETEFLKKELNITQKLPSNSCIDGITSDGDLISMKNHKISKKNTIMMACPQNVIKNSKKAEKNNKKYIQYILDYENTGNSFDVKNFTSIDLTGIHNDFIGSAIEEEIKKLDKEIKIFNGKTIPADKNLEFNNRVIEINGLIKKKTNKRDKKGSLQKIFGIQKTFDYKRLSYRIQCHLASIDLFILHYPDRFINYGVITERGFDVRTIICPI